ncbi:MAG: O-antigen ligase family protein [Devosiaceae bacterium]|nr:O-antigen ligase family protein [Devosiaceae bacterium]
MKFSAKNPLSQKMPMVAWWAIIILILLATPVFGTLAAIFVLIAAILTMPVLFSSNAWNTTKSQPMLISFFLGFVLFALVSALNATELADMRFVANFLPFILAAPVYVLAGKMGGEKATLLLLSLCLAGSFIALLVALNDTQIQNAIRAEGYFSGSIVFARNAATLGFVAAFGFIVARGPIRFIFLAGPIFAISATLLAQSRGTIIAAPILLAMLAFFFLRHAPGKTAKRLLILGGTILIVGMIAFFASSSGTRISALFEIIQQLLQSGSSEDESVNIRLDFYRTGIELFGQSPLFGHGWAKMSELVYAILDPAKYGTLLVEKFHFHNDMLNFAVSGGVLGIISYFLFLFGPLIGAIKTSKDRLFDLRLQMLGLLTMLFFISGLTDMVIGFDLPTTQFAMLGALILGAVRADT